MAFNDTSFVTNNLVFIETSPCKIVRPFVYILAFNDTSFVTNNLVFIETSSCKIVFPNVYIFAFNDTSLVTKSRLFDNISLLTTIFWENVPVPLTSNVDNAVYSVE